MKFCCFCEDISRKNVIKKKVLDKVKLVMLVIIERFDRRPLSVVAIVARV